MSIKNIKERLEGSYRLIRIKRIKMGFFAIEMILALILGTAMAFLMGATFDPFYFPVDVFSFIILIMLLVITVETIYFNGLELKYTRNKSRKYLLARNAIRRSIVIIVIFGFCILALMLPYTQETISDTHSPTFSHEVPGLRTYTNTSFPCQDKLGLTRTSNIHIEVDQDTAQNAVTLVLGNATGGINIWSPLPSCQYNWTALAEHSSLQDSIYVVVENKAATPVNFSYSVTSEVSPFIKVYMPALGLAFIIVQFAAISIMYPIRETHASSSIYSKNYVAETDSGEYSVSDIKLTRKEKEEEAILDKALDMELPPPEPVKSKHKLQEEKCKIEDEEMARFKGKVDDGLIEEPDVECTSCGEMNSAQSAMCYSCGTALRAAEKLAIDPIAYIKKGESFANVGRFDDAISCYDEALKHDGSSETALLRKGEALHKLGKWGSAVQYVNTALKVNPNNVETLVLKAKILEERDRMDKSIEIYSQILALEPENAFAKSRMRKVKEEPIKTAEEVEIESAEDVLEQFMSISGVGLARATALYEAGFTSFDMLKNASEEKLVEVKGISKGLAKKIKKGLEEL